MFHEQAIKFSWFRKRYVSSVLRKVRALKPAFARYSDDELVQQSKELGFRAQSGEQPEQLVADAFALLQEASHRTLGMRHYDVQLIAGINLVSQCSIEMATGEGKTLTAILPLYLYSLYGKGAHLATANDYLSRRDGTEMKPVFQRLGLTVGILQNNTTDAERYEMYRCDVTYGTMTEFGFDFLRDRMKRRVLQEITGEEAKQFQPVCRTMHFVLVDEADSIMIDDASTPLIIGAMPGAENPEKSRLYRWAARFAPQAREGNQFRFVEHKKEVELTEAGRIWARKVASETDVAGLAAVDQFEFIERAIKVEREYFRDKNYVLNNENEVTIIDENTGRLAVGRFWQDGMHQAIQAREGVQITAPSSSAARLSVQTLVSSYPHRAGMTGTAMSSKREFRKVYKMDVVRIPTRKKCRRKKQATTFYENEDKKNRAICNAIVSRRRKGQPVLVGTRSVAKSEALARLLDQHDIEYTILNARNEAKEAAIVECAGEPGTVTISTSMAGRGTDIKLYDGVEELGGLHVILTELNDSQRIDRQLIGRCARQGDPGTYEIFLSPDDSVFEARNNNDFWRKMLDTLPAVSREWVYRQAQKRISSKRMRERLQMLDSEKKRLRTLRQAGLDPVLDVVD